MEAVKFYKDPKLRNPKLIAAWPGMGGVAIIAARYLRERLEAKEFGCVEPYEFFDPNMVSIQDNVVEEPEFPDCKFYSWKRRGTKNLVIFTGDGQPSMKGYKFANLVLDAAQNLKAKKVFTFAAAPNHVHHAKKPRVLGAVTSPELVLELEEYGVTPINSGSISGMNGLLLGVAQERNMAGVCLLGEIPVYATQIPNPKSSKAILEVVTKMLDLEVDLSGLDDWIKKMDDEMEGIIARFTESYGEEAKWLVDYFERLKQASEEEAELGDYGNEELLREIEQFLRRERKEEEGH
jgi:proteasome assembly chaperone (PAC2) family protein